MNVTNYMLTWRICNFRTPLVDGRIAGLRVLNNHFMGKRCIFGSVLGLRWIGCRYAGITEVLPPWYEDE